LTPSTAKAAGLIKAEEKKRNPRDEAEQATFTSPKQELEHYLSEVVLPLKMAMNTMTLFNGGRTSMRSTNTLKPLQNNILQFEHLLHLLREYLARPID
jgi:hypothetical protein